MRKVVGVGFVVVLMAAGSSARAEPVSAAKFAGAGACRELDRLQVLSAAGDSARSAAAFTWRDDNRFRLGDDEESRGYSSYLPAGWMEPQWHRARFVLLADRDLNAGLHLGWFKNDRFHSSGHGWESKQLAKFLAQIHERFKDHRSAASADPQIAATPEPASFMLLGSGALGLLGLRRKKQA